MDGLEQRAFTFMEGWAEELVAQQRAALITFRLARGDRLTTAQVATLAGLGYVGAWLMMEKISEVIPIYRDGHTWVMLERS